MFESLLKSNSVPIERCECSPIVMIKRYDAYNEEERSSVAKITNLRTPEFKYSSRKKEYIEKDNRDNFEFPVDFRQKINFNFHKNKMPLINSSVLNPTSTIRNNFNVTNNFYFNLPQRKTSPSNLSKETFQEKKNFPSSVYLNQVKLNGVSLEYFPTFNFNKKDFSLDLVHKFEELEVVGNSKEKTISYLTKAIKSNSFRINFSREMKEFDLTGINFKNYSVADIVKGFYLRIKENIAEIQKNLILGKRRSQTHHLVIKTFQLIKKTNDLFQVIIKCIKSSKKIFSKTSKNDSCDIFMCQYCHKRFQTGQGLGGHMSRIHPNKSEKYKKKISIRNNRSEHRIALLDSKRELLRKHGRDYDSLKEEKNGKSLINSILFKNLQEYKGILKRIKMERNLLNK